MKIIILSFLIFVSSVFVSSACDFCNGYLSLDPGYNKHTVGLRSNYRYATHMMPATGGMKIMHGGDMVAPGTPMEEWTASYLGFDLHARVYPFKKLQVVATIPFQISTLTFADKEESRSALSDLTLLGMYQVANTMPDDSIGVRHRIFAGGGIKLPTGKSSGAADADIPMSHHLYSGTGSTDYLVLVSYIGKFNRLGWNADISYKMNGESANNYRYGNTFNAVPRVFYEVGTGNVKFFPHLGAAFEFGNKEEYLDTVVEETGGSVVWGTAGADLYFGNFSLTTDVRIPVSQDLGASIPEDKFWLFTSFNIHF